MSGAEVIAVVACVAGVISAFNDGSKLLAKIKDKRRAQAAMRDEQTKSLEESLALGPPTIRTEYDRDVRRFGSQFAEGDNIAREALKDIIIELQASILVHLKNSWTQDIAVCNFHSLELVSDDSRVNTVVALGQLYQRMAARASIPSSPPSRNIFRRSSRATRTLSTATTVRESRDSGMFGSLPSPMSSLSDEKLGSARLTCVPWDQSIPEITGMYPENSENTKDESLMPLPLRTQESPPGEGEKRLERKPQAEGSLRSHHSHHSQQSRGSHRSVSSSNAGSSMYSPNSLWENPWGGSSDGRRSSETIPGVNIVSRADSQASASSGTMPDIDLNIVQRHPELPNRNPPPRSFSNPVIARPSSSVIAARSSSASQTSTSPSLARSSPILPQDAFSHVPHRLTLPSESNDFAGFCKGAWKLQIGASKKALKLEYRPQGMYNRIPYWRCSKCSFEGPAMTPPGPGKAKDKDIAIETRIRRAQGILYRWAFLAKCHVKTKNFDSTSPDAGTFGCIFCCAEGRGTPVYGNVKEFMQHLQQHRLRLPSAELAGRTNCVAGRYADPTKESFDICLLPLVVEDKI
ncbi:MAG: hypothetical protein M1834_001223 [Cirrosporium novae-zelandiae]|nr:MAG: hypothetical protein M1834_001223 [Cirrosporium novae-zelandiae]